MKFSVGVEYAIHCLLYMVKTKEGQSIGIRDLATFQGISETYLSKVYAKLSKAGIIKSTPGVKGGYELARSAEEITFWDVVEAVEGKEHFFQCAEIRQNGILIGEDSIQENHKNCPCLINVVMLEAESAMKNYLNTKTLAWLHNEVYNEIFTKEMKQKTIKWFEDRTK